MSIQFVTAEPWAAHPAVAPICVLLDGQHTARSTGPRLCCGGWQFTFGGFTPGLAYRVEWETRHEGVACRDDELAAMAIWGRPDPANVRLGAQFEWDYIFATPVGEGAVQYAAVLVAPEGADTLTLRDTLRWTASGETRCPVPIVTCLGEPARPAPVRVAVVTGTETAARASRPTIAAGIAFYADLCERACAAGATLVALPEVCLDWHVPGHPVDHAMAVPGPETERFAELARAHQATIVVGLHERAGSDVYNSAVVIDADGTVAGIYHKVHLASFEAFSGVVPGDGFPVFPTAAGRIGCNICMDSSATESSRMVGLNGADFLVLPIMGDHRASVWQRGNPVLDEERWRRIMSVRAMDNQLCMVVARNNSRASCIIDRSGEFLAYNDGTADFIVADVPVDPPFRKWNGGSFLQVNWRQRRPHLYGAFVAETPAALARQR